MSTLRDKIKTAVAAQLESVTLLDDVADALEPLVREAQAGAWDEACWQISDGENHAEIAIVYRKRNPYRAAYRVGEEKMRWSTPKMVLRMEVLMWSAQCECQRIVYAETPAGVIAAMQKHDVDREEADHD